MVDRVLAPRNLPVATATVPEPPTTDAPAPVPVAPPSGAATRGLAAFATVAALLAAALLA